MKKKGKILIAIIIIILILFFSPKQYARSGGFAGLPKDNECKCLGFDYSYYPEGCADCFTAYNCAGIPYDCHRLCYANRTVVPCS